MPPDLDPTAEIKRLIVDVSVINISEDYFCIEITPSTMTTLLYALFCS
jgi:hypothetical protein